LDKSKLISPLLGVVIAVLLLGCGKKIPDQPLPNQPPETHLSLFPEGELRTTTSRQILYWWGDDPDGLVIGFIYTWEVDTPVPETWDPSNPAVGWTFTEATNDTFSLRFFGSDTVYTFRVSAVDNGFAVDPTPATQSFPVANTPPTIEYTLNTDIPETTFTVAAFSWRGSDLDGDDTIQRFQYVLEDTTDPSRYIDLPPDVNLLLLREEDGLTEGEHVFYIRAVDIAGATSPFIRMPKREDRVWYVKKPRGPVLVVDDYSPEDDAASFYAGVLGGTIGDFSVLDIKIDRNRDTRPDFLPPITAMFTETLRLFRVVLWYADDAPQLEQAQIALPVFIEGGGKVLFTTLLPQFFGEQGAPLDFTPVDSVDQEIGRLFNGQGIEPALSGWPTLTVDSPSRLIPFVKSVAPKPTSRVVYRLPESRRWQGTPAVGVEDVTRSFVFFVLPLHQLDGQGTVAQVIEKVLKEEFGI
jgi:hypothetical protein